MIERFDFKSGGEKLIGNLHLPEGPTIAAAVTTGPLTSVKEQAPTAYAKALSSRGIATLAFDHRTFGESGGGPREFENPFAKVEDLLAAFAALKADLRTRAAPLVAVGICAGAGYMAEAVAQSADVRAFAGVAGYYGQSTPESIQAAAPAIARGEAAERGFRDTGISDSIPAVGPNNGDVAMPLTEAYEYYGTSRGAVANYSNNFALASYAYTPKFNSIDAAARIKAPTLIVHSEHALAPSLARLFYSRLAARHEELWLQSKGQIDFYDDPKLIEPAANAIVQFFSKVLSA